MYQAYSGYGQIDSSPTTMRVWGNLTEEEWDRERNTKRQHHDPAGMNIFKFTLHGEVVEEIRLPDLAKLALKLRLQFQYPKGQKP